MKRSHDSSEVSVALFSCTSLIVLKVCPIRSQQQQQKPRDLLLLPPAYRRAGSISEARGMENASDLPMDPPGMGREAMLVA